MWSRDGLALEGTFESPDDATGGVALCHPHPQMGGTMSAPLLTALATELVRRRWAVLRFNFRGIGDSEGESSTGLDEVADAEGAVDFLRERLPGAPVAIAGWSFGGAVAVRIAAEDPSLAACVAIAPAVTKKPGVTEGLPDPAGLVIDVPLLMICAANDELVDVDDARRWTEGVPAARLEVMPGANHFFWAKYEPLAAQVGDFLDDVL